MLLEFIGLHRLIDFQNKSTPSILGQLAAESQPIMSCNLRNYCFSGRSKNRNI
jgi:hypothetical protein